MYENSDIVDKANLKRKISDNKLPFLSLRALVRKRTKILDSRKH